MADQDKLLLKVGLQLDEVIADFKRLNGAVDGVDSKLKKGSAQWQSSFAKFGLAVNGIEQGFRILDRTVGTAVRGIANFQTGMVKVNTLVNLSTANFNRLTKSVISLSKEIPQTVGQLSEGLYQVVSAGVEAGDSLKFLETSAKAAVAGFTKTEVSVDAITSVINAFGLEANQAEAVADKFFTTVKLGKTDLDQLTPSLGQFVPQAAAAGISFDQVAASMATLTKNAIPTARAATGIGRAITEMIKPASKAELAIKDLGFASGQAGIDQLGFQGVINALSEDGANFVEIFGDEAARAVLTLGTKSQQAASDLDEMTRSAGAMNTAFGLANDTLDNQAILMKNQLSALYLNFSDVLIPGWTSALKDLNAVLANQSALEINLAKAGGDELKQVRAKIEALDQLNNKYKGQAGFLRGVEERTHTFRTELEGLGVALVQDRDIQVTVSRVQVRLNELKQDEIDLLKQLEQGAIDEERARKEQERISAAIEAAQKLKKFDDFREDVHKSQLSRIKAEETALKSLTRIEQNRVDAFISNNLKQLSDEDARVDRLFELGTMSTIQYINQLKMRADAEEEGGLRRLEIEDQIEQLQLQRFDRLRLGFKEFLKGEAIDWITAKQVEMLASLGAIWAKAGVTSGFTLAPDLAYYGTGIAILEGAKSLITAFAEGGGVKKPTLAMIGEAGPEFVAPEKKFEQYSRDTLTPMIMKQTEAALSRDNGAGVMGAGMKQVKEAVDGLVTAVSQPYTLLRGTQLQVMNNRLARGSFAL